MIKSTIRMLIFGAASLCCIFLLPSFLSAAQEVDPKEVPAYTATQLSERAQYRRAVEAVNWGMPAVSYARMYQAALDAGAEYNQIVFWSGLSDWKNQTLTPNSDLIYFMPFFSTKEAGPMVLEIPAAKGAGSITGTIMDVWQAALEDVGPAGVDRGKGGKYLILPPEYKRSIPKGYIPLPSSNFQGYALLRSVLKDGSPKGVAAALAYGKRIKLYPLSRASNPPATTFVDVIDTVFDATIPYDLRYFESLDRIVQYEPWLPRDRAMIDMLRSIGIEKGKPFNPDPRLRQTLGEAIDEAHAWINARFENVLPTYYEGTQWTYLGTEEFIETMTSFYEAPNKYSVDARGLMDFWAFTTIKHPGAGQFYVGTIKDKDGRFLAGDHTYRLNVPANAPVTQYWSATVYSRLTHAFIRNAPWPSRSSQTPNLAVNQDGSVDIYFAPKAPAGKESNWIATKPGENFEVLFRVYGPEKSFFDKTWSLPDIERAE